MYGFKERLMLIKIEMVSASQSEKKDCLSTIGKMEGVMASHITSVKKAWKFVVII